MILFDSTQLGNIQLLFNCYNADCESEGQFDVSVDPTFFEDSGNPCCGDCGDDLQVYGAQVDDGDETVVAR